MIPAPKTASKVVLVTGASSGIGEATALGLAAAGHSVVLGARRLERHEVIASEISRSGGTADVRQIDVTDREAVAAFVDYALDRHGASMSSSTTRASCRCPGSMRCLSTSGTAWST